MRAFCNLCLGDIEHALVPLPALRCAPRSAGAGRPYSRHPAAAVSYESSASRGLSGHTTQTFSTAKQLGSIPEEMSSKDYHFSFSYY